ncbi:hypothetical protein RhiLY_05500 [Ceratobasidium sp. AG-Ba]|nr:hypothetical protein RhiLY_05500 [Ceratobasidium sp. AG-Ba]
MAFAKHASDCSCCRGPAAWSVLYPLAPTSSIDSNALSAHSQPEIARSKSKADWFRIPNWALPTRATPLAGPDDEPLITLDTILAGRTKSPIRVGDLRAFLRNEEGPNVAAVRSLEFLLAYNSFRAAFFALPPEKQAPRPSTMQQSLSLANKAAEIQSTFAQLPSTPQLARPQAAKANVIHSYPHLDPETQPMRRELQNIIDLYLQPHSLSPVTSLVSPNVLHKALSEAKLTTHPSALDPVASNIHSYMSTEVLPQFLDHAVSNLSATTSRGRLIVACIAAAAAIVLEFFLIMYKTSRVARLLAMPLWILAIGYAIGSRTGLCFWLAMRGTREHRSYEPISSPALTDDSIESKVDLVHVHPEPPQRPRTLFSRISQFTSKDKSLGEIDQPDSMAEKGRLPAELSLGGATDDKRLSRKLRKNQSGEYSVSRGSVQTRSSRHKRVASIEIVKNIVRLTGTAVNTIPVEDTRIRKLQALVGLRVAIFVLYGISIGRSHLPLNAGNLSDVARLNVPALRLGLVSLLLLTTCLYNIRWHPVVGVILWQSVPMAICSLLHYPLHKTLREHLPIVPAERPLDQQHTPLAHFCAIDAILLYVFSAIGSALTVSFTLSLFAVVVKSGNPNLNSSRRAWWSFQWLWDPSTTVLCVGPFVWALPIVITAIEALVRSHRDDYPSIYYSNTFCNIDDYTYQFASGIILGVPLLVSVGLVLATLIMIIRIYLRDRVTATQSINVYLAFRFAVIVVQIFVLAILLLCEIALRDDQLAGVFRFHLYWAALAPLVLFVIFGTQIDLMQIWKYWGYRLVGKHHTFTPRSSNEAATLSNSSGPATTTNTRFVVETATAAAQDVHTSNRKVHRASSSAGGRDSASISDAPDFLGAKHATDFHRDEVTSGADLEHSPVRTTPRHYGKHSRHTPASSLPVLPYTAEISAPPTPTTSTRQHDFYSTGGDMSSQGLESAISHSGGRALLDPRHGPPRSNQPFIIVTDGFGAMFGAQVPSEHARMMGLPIISPQERDRRLGVPTATRHPPSNAGPRAERRKSVGLPPPPRSPRQSNARPNSAGGASVLDLGTGERGRPAPAGSGVSVASPTPVIASWNWDLPFRPAEASTGLASTVTHGGSGGGSRGEYEGIEMHEHLKTPSSGSFEPGVNRLSQEHHSDSARGSWTQASRVSVASDRTFG